MEYIYYFKIIKNPKKSFDQYFPHFQALRECQTKIKTKIEFSFTSWEGWEDIFSAIIKTSV